MELPICVDSDAACLLPEKVHPIECLEALSGYKTKISGNFFIENRRRPYHRNNLNSIQVRFSRHGKFGNDCYNLEPDLMGLYCEQPWRFLTG